MFKLKIAPTFMIEIRDFLKKVFIKTHYFDVGSEYDDGEFTSIF